MIHPVRDSGPWFDLDEVAAIEVILDEHGHTRVTLKSGNECDFFAASDHLQALVAAWIAHDRRRNTDLSDQRKALT